MFLTVKILYRGKLVVEKIFSSFYCLSCLSLLLIKLSEFDTAYVLFTHLRKPSFIVDQKQTRLSEHIDQIRKKEKKTCTNSTKSSKTRHRKNKVLVALRLSDGVILIHIFYFLSENAFSVLTFLRFHFFDLNCVFLLSSSID
jgi:hypothetical protein